MDVGDGRRTFLALLTDPSVFTKDRFEVDLSYDTVTCPAGVSVAVKRHRSGGGLA
jgi:hypothetical protein